MLAKKVEQSSRDWDQHLPYILFAYRASMQESVKESPFYLVYGRDPRLPTTLDVDTKAIQEIDVDTYKALRFNETWGLPQYNIW